MNIHFVDPSVFTKSVFATICLIFSCGPNAWSLPSHKRLWETKYGYKVSCSLCHSKGGGSQLNPYGEDFQRFGMTPSAFGRIEERDSDKDGFSNIVEIRAKSNPGDALSVPSKPTDWLSRIEDSLIPLKELKSIFSTTSKFSVLEGTLKPAQIKDVETRLNSKLSDTDSVPTFYFAIKDEGGRPVRTGVALFSTPLKNPDKLIVGVGIDLSGLVTHVILIKNSFGAELGKPAFLTQFEGKSQESNFAVGKEIQPASAGLNAESAQVAEAVKKALLIVKTVFTKN